MNKLQNTQLYLCFSTLKDLSKERFYTNVYIKSHMRSMPYFVGMMAGYLYMTLKDAGYQLSLVI